MGSDSSDASLAAPRGGSIPTPHAAWRALRSGFFFAVYFAYLVLWVGLGQRLVLWPIVTLFPGRRRTIVGRWLRHNGRLSLALCRVFANVRITVREAIEPTPCVVVMNHQSVLDIALGLALVPPPALIPTRRRYRTGIPGISPLTRLARFPPVSQERTAARAEIAALVDAAEQVARGEQSLLIFPEGHRSRDGAIGPFMTSGLRLVLARAQRPVYCIVADGAWHARTFADAATSFADSRVRAVVLGPFIPPEPRELAAFIDSLRDRMVQALAELRAAPPAET